jgi:hypothetical protein
MATIRRHPVPLDSYAPNRPLNDLLREQLAHFIHVEERLPPSQRVKMPIPAADDADAANRFIAAVTEQLMSIKRSPPLRLIRRRTPQPPSPGITIAAKAATPKSPRAATKKKSTLPESKRQSRSRSK